MIRNRHERLQIMLDDDELRAVDDFRYDYRLPSRAAAVRELLKRGLNGAKTGQVDDGSRSKDFGVLGTKNGSSFREPRN
jgi:metal-responsive CopG/Arc/MetJ family transcriptional regulator